MSRISIVTISYNQAGYLEDCIQSVLRNRGDWLEYIVVDPGSTDGSLDIIEKYRDDIDVLITEKDAGPADGLRKGFSKATGDIFGYVNADDRLMDSSLGFVRDFFAGNDDVDVLCGAIRVINGKGKPSRRKRVSDPFDPARYASGLVTICQQATFFRRDLYLRAGGFNVDNRIAWDGELMVDMALAGGRFRVINKLLADFRVYEGTISSSAVINERLEEFLARVRRKLESAGVGVYGPAQAKVLKILYKFNIYRHLMYYLVS